MFSNNKVTTILLFISACTLNGCTSEGDSISTEPSIKAIKAALQVTNTLDMSTLDTQPFEPVWHQEELRFHGVVQGIHSYNETIFEQGKIITLNATEGQLVNKGDVIAELYSPVLAERLEQAKAGLKRTQAQLTLDKDSFARNKTLYNKNLISQQALDEAKRDFDTAKQAMREAESSVSQANNEFAATSIKAKENGVVAEIFKREGDFINPGDPVFRFESVAKQKVSFALPEKLAVTIQHGDQHKIYVPSNRKELTGTVVEKSLPTSDGIRLHTITFEIDSLKPEFVGLRVVLRYMSEKVLAFKVDYRAIRYNEDNQPYLIGVNDALEDIPISILDMRNQSILISASAQPNTPILVGNEVSLPVNLHTF